MKILFVAQEEWYEDIVSEIEAVHDVDYVFKSTPFKVDMGRYHIPKLFGFNRGFKVLSCLVVGYLLLFKKYDICITDYKAIYFTTFLPIVRKHTKIIRTNFIYDIRTIPVGYIDSDAKKFENSFLKKLKYANANYQGITLITPEIKRYIQDRYIKFTIPVGIWESGVDVEQFKPLPHNEILKRKLGFSAADFICFYHGSLGYRRGVIELVESLKIVSAKEKKIKLLIVGEGESLGEIKRLIKELCLEDIVVINRWVPKCEIAEFISLADLCVVPLADIDWWRVSSPLKLMEYIACGKNIVLTKMIAHTNVLGNSSSVFWLNQVSPTCLAEKILEAYYCFLENKTHYFNRGNIARDEIIANISWKSRARSLESFLDDEIMCSVY